MQYLPCLRTDCESPMPLRPGEGERREGWQSALNPKDGNNHRKPIEVHLKMSDNHGLSFKMLPLYAVIFCRIGYKIPCNETKSNFSSVVTKFPITAHLLSDGNHCIDLAPPPSIVRNIQSSRAFYNAEITNHNPRKSNISGAMAAGGGIRCLSGR